MGVNHLIRDANKASGTVASGKELPGAIADSKLHTNLPNGPLPHQVSNSNALPKTPGVDAYSKAALRPSTAAPQPPKGNQNGARAGKRGVVGPSVSGQASGNMRGMSGGRLN